jgi:hypothetical protein
MTDILSLDRNRSWDLVAKENGNDRSVPHGTFVYVVSPGYLETMGMRLRGSRDLSWHDRSDTQHAIIINEAAARREWPGPNPIGRAAYGPGRGEASVVGVYLRCSGSQQCLQRDNGAAATCALQPFAQSPISLVSRTVDCVSRTGQSLVSYLFSIV